MHHASGSLAFMSSLLQRFRVTWRCRHRPLRKSGCSGRAHHDQQRFKLSLKDVPRGLRQVFTRPLHTQDHGKVERFIQTALRANELTRPNQDAHQPHWTARGQLFSFLAFKQTWTIKKKQYQCLFIDATACCQYQCRQSLLAERSDVPTGILAGRNKRTADQPRPP